MKFCRAPVWKRLIVAMVVIGLLVSGVGALPTRAAGETPTGASTTVNDTSINVGRVVELADSMYKLSNFKTQIGPFDWEKESQKYRAWTYYTGIMMKAYMMLNEYSENNYYPYIKEYYDYNINDAGNGLNKNQTAPSGKTNQNDYKERELDTTPPSRALVNLIGTTYASDKYTKMVDFVYANFEKYKVGYVNNTTYSVYGYFPDYGGNFRHKIVEKSATTNKWLSYPIALDGIYMAQPFFMEVANALKNGTLKADQFTQTKAMIQSLYKTETATQINQRISDALDYDKIFEAVYNRLLWVGNNLYEEKDYLGNEAKLFAHGWGENPQGNGKETNHQFWLRAIGWYAAALADVIDLFPKEDKYNTYREKLLEIARDKLFKGMLKYQDWNEEKQSGTGMWRNVVNYDDKVTYVQNGRITSEKSGNVYETSGTALVAYAMLRLYVAGYVGDEYGEAGLRAFNGTVSEKLNSENTSLTDIYVSAGVETDPTQYLKANFADNEAKGVGPLMMAAAYAKKAALIYEQHQTPKEIEYTAEPYSGTYDATSHTIDLNVTTPDSGAVITYKTSEDGEYNLDTAPSYTDVGTYTVYFQITADGYTSATGFSTVTISPKDVSNATVTLGPSLTYNSSKQTQTIESVVVDELQATYDVSENTGTNAGYYTLTVTGKGNFTGTKTVEWSIGKADIDPTVSIEGWTYGDDPNTPTVDGNPENGAVTYSYKGAEDDTYVDEVPTNVGDYTVKATVAATNNYASAEATKDFSISQKALTITADSDTKAFDGTALTKNSFTYSELATGDAIASVTITGSQTDVGESDNVASGAVIKKGDADVTGNYAIQYVNGTLTVTKAASAVKKTPEAINPTYTGEAQALIEAGEANGGTMQYSLDGEKYSAAIPSGTDAGTYTVWYKVVGDQNHDDSALDSLTVEIKKEASSITTAPIANSLTYTGEAQALIEPGSATGGAIQYSLDGENYSTTIPTGTAAGAYTVWYKVVGDGNHEDSARDSLTVEVKKANQDAPEAPTQASASATSITLKTVEGCEYSVDGQNWQESPTFTGLEPNKEYTFYQRKKGDDNHNESLSSEGANITTSAHEHDWQFTAQDGVITATCTAEGHVGAEIQSITLSIPAHTAYGDKKNAEATVSGSIDGVTPTIEYKVGETVLSGAPTKAGIYTVLITVGDATAKLDYTIESKPVKVEGLYIADKTYDGTTDASFSGTPRLVDADKTEGLGAGTSFIVVDDAVESGDEVILDVTGTFDSADVGDDKDVDVSVSLSGADAGNYRLTKSTMKLKASILAATPNTHTVTFKVVNGKWNDGTTGDKTEQVAHEGTLTAEQIPRVGNKPADNYKAGSWDRTPVTNQAITADTTYTYTYAPEEAVIPSGVSTGTITISGLDDTDTVKIYQVISWEPNTGWKLEEPFDTITDLASKMGLANEPISINTDLVNEINGCVTSSTDAYATGNPSSGTYTTTVPKGMYIAIITSGNAGTIYNPIIVSADFDKDGSVDAPTSSIPISRSSDYGGNTAVVKKENITLTKTGEDAISHDKKDGNPVHETVAVGDTITFTITTTIPPFATYLHPSFVLTDEMSTGLTYTDKSVKVEVPEGLVEDNQYEVTNESDKGYTLSFDEGYLKTIAVNTPVTITYTAKVTTNAVNSINHENNTVTLEYSNNPNTSTDKGKLKDRTNHYTFTIDGSLLGHTGYEATEVVKVGVDPSGNEITKSTTLSNQGKVGALEGAHFALYKVNEGWGEKTAYTYTDIGGNTVSYADITSGSDGRITLKGLDAGKYLLEETQAPAGYIRDTNPVRIEITANVQPKTYVEDGCTIETDELVSYTVQINNAQTASYTITNSSIATSSVSNEGDTVVGKSDDKGKIKNYQGAELPSTGGEGTKIFYSIGALLMLFGGILIVSHRRAA